MKIPQKYKEPLFIILVWTLIFASAPLYMYYAKLVIDSDFTFADVWSTWRYVLAFFVLFLLHHYLLMPMLMDKKRYWAYGGGLLVALILFVAYLNMIEPHHPRPEMPLEFANHHREPRPFLLPPPDMARMLIAVMMLGVDFGVMAWINEQKMRQRVLLLEQQNLKQELEHLHYQINPHFFMNTLNNIHVLIDLDQERAKRSVVELSSLMRYALYEGNGTMVSLFHEMEFVRLYISLMKLRYTDKVDINFNMPNSAPTEVQMPPLLLATFIENAFKHGVSCLSPSYIYVSLSFNSETRLIHFSCVNSRHPQKISTPDSHHGIGLENVRKRLDLIYGQKYQLMIDEHDESQFKVNLEVPY